MTQEELKQELDKRYLLIRVYRYPGRVPFEARVSEGAKIPGRSAKGCGPTVELAAENALKNWDAAIFTENLSEANGTSV